MIKRNYLYYRFNLTLLMTLFVTLLGCFGINYIVDPYRLFDSPKLSRFNQVKPYEDSQRRLSKLLEIKRLNPQIIVVGSSRVLSGIDLQKSGLLAPKTSYNLGLPGAYIDELIDYLQYIINNNQKVPQKIIIGIDFYMFNENELDYAQKDVIKTIIRGASPIIEAGKTGFSVDALMASQKTIVKNINTKDNDQPQKKDNIEKFQYWLKAFLGKNNWYFNYTLSPKKLDEFKKIIDLCQKNNIELILFISPTHATHNEVIRLLGLWNIFEEWKREIAKIAPVWDFSGYNSVTTETISKEMKNYNDNSHYSPKVGDLVLKRILNQDLEQVPDDFGILINPNNIDSYLAKIRRDRQQWANNNRDEIQFVKDVQKSQK